MPSWSYQLCLVRRFGIGEHADDALERFHQRLDLFVGESPGTRWPSWRSSCLHSRWVSAIHDAGTVTAVEAGQERFLL